VAHRILPAPCVTAYDGVFGDVHLNTAFRAADIVKKL
jgi:hypothetical protein